MMPNLQRFNDGTFIDWGRHWRGMSVDGKRLDGDGAARYYAGEAAEVMELILKHERKAGDGE